LNKLGKAIANGAHDTGFKLENSMHIHILGICGTFMGSLALLARSLGHRVTGCDANVYPPMSTQLEQSGIELIQGFDPEQLKLEPDLVIVGNAMSRGNPVVEALLDSNLPYTSGPQWLREHVLQDKWVLAVAGTHGKTTTSSMLAWILEYAGMSPGFLIGGIPKNFTESARLGETPFFVVEADEYDSAFFDKRSKFVHYRARTLTLNNLEYDHADIFPDLAAIQRQFHHVVRTVPQNGLIVVPQNNPALDEVLAQGCWTPVTRFALSESIEPGVDDGEPGSDWLALPLKSDGSRFELWHQGQMGGTVDWSMTGDHNVYNALAAAAAAHNVGVAPEVSAAALSSFEGVKRRMECIATMGGVKVYDDFAHHPSAIQSTLAGLRRQVGEQKIIAMIEPRSNTMRLGMHKKELGQACINADFVMWYEPAGMNWSMQAVADDSPVPAVCEDSIEDMLDTLGKHLEQDCHIVIMSNGSFGGIHALVVDKVKQVLQEQLG
jgi:UDP-N-acetylmuramate: L-alanyl-gamma-D-glutamyl-meso-diaminopimelate ligase